MQEIKRPSQLVLIGGGASIKEGIEKGLWEKITGKLVMGINYSFNHFPDPTIQMYCDRLFYQKQFEQLKKLGLVIGKKHGKMKLAENTVVFPSTSKYIRNLDAGIYKASLTGMFSLSLGIYLLDRIGSNENQVFLLGMDYGELRKKDYEKVARNKIELENLSYKDSRSRILTHYYQGEIEHRGIAKTNYYNENKRAERDYGPYKDIKNPKIYNVSLQSKIPSTIFEKISYDTFFKLLDNNIYDQDNLRKLIRPKLPKYNK